MTLSIYIPVLKRDGLFDRCMKSIECAIDAAGDAGLPKGDYEIVVIEGVSPVGAARNEALRRMKGDWIAAVDSDDEVEESWFVEICRAIREAEKPDSEIDDIVFDMTVVWNGRKVPHRYGRSGLIEAKIVVADVLRDIRLGGHLVRHVSRRSLWNEIRFADVQVMEDASVLPLALAKARRALSVDKALYRYYVRDGSLCRSTKMSVFFEIAVERVAKFGKVAEIGACVAAYNCLYDQLDRDGTARGWIWRHLLTALGDHEVPAKWKIKFILASLGIIIRRPK